jgi:hypothetical protein
VGQTSSQQQPASTVAKPSARWPTTALHPPRWNCNRRQRQEQERIAEEAAKQRSGIVTLQGMFRTNISAPGEQPTGVVLVDGYNLLFRVGGGAGVECSLAGWLWPGCAGSACCSGWVPLLGWRWVGWQAG